jgi:hypothetical protein
VSKPQGYRQSAAEAMFCLLVLCLPYYQSLLFAGLGRTICLLLLTCILMFLVVRSTDFCQALAACLSVLPSFWPAPVCDPGIAAIVSDFVPVPRAPSLSPLFQRPPPFSA